MAATGNDRQISVRAGAAEPPGMRLPAGVTIGPMTSAPAAACA